MSCQYKLEQEIPEFKETIESKHRRLPNSIIKRFKHKARNARATVSGDAAIPGWIEEAGGDWLKETFTDTTTFKYFRVIALILLERVSGNRFMHNPHWRREFIVWMQGVHSETHSFVSLVHLHLRADDFFEDVDIASVEDGRLTALRNIWFAICGEHEFQEDEDKMTQYANDFMEGWLSCPEDFKEELHNALEIIIRVHARKELFAINKARMFLEPETEEMLQQLSEKAS